MTKVENIAILRVKKALELAKQYHWQVISMKQDFKQIFSFASQ